MADVALDEVGYILHRRDAGIVDGISEVRQARVHLLLDSLRRSFPVCLRYLSKGAVGFLNDCGGHLRDGSCAAHQRIGSYANDGQDYENAQQGSNSRYQHPVESRPATCQGSPLPEPHHRGRARRQ